MPIEFNKVSFPKYFNPEGEAKNLVIRSKSSILRLACKPKPCWEGVLLISFVTSGLLAPYFNDLSFLTLLSSRDSINAIYKRLISF